MVEQLATQVDRGLGQATDIGHRIDRAGSAIEQGGGDLLGAGGGFTGRAGQQLDRRAPAFPLGFPAAQVGLAPGVVRHVQGAFAAQLAIDTVFVDQAEHQGRRRPQHAVELAADRLAETGLDLVRRDPHPGIHQAHVASRTTVAGAVGFQYTDPFALLQQVHGGRQAGKTRADHADIHPDLALERGIVRPLRRQYFPQAFFA